MEGLNILVGVAIYHTIHKGVFAIFELDIFGQLHFTARVANVERDIVCTFV